MMFFNQILEDQKRRIKIKILFTISVIYVI